jgi:hypothetical protein
MTCDWEKCGGIITMQSSFKLICRLLIGLILVVVGGVGIIYNVQSEVGEVMIDNAITQTKLMEKVTTMEPKVEKNHDFRLSHQ